MHLKDDSYSDPDISSQEEESVSVDECSLAEELRLFNNLSSLADSALSLHV